MLWIVYVLKFRWGRYYVWSTMDIQKRFVQHQNGEVTSTKNNRPLTLLFSKEYSTIKEARQKEYRIKKQKSRKIVEKFIRWELE